MLELTSFNITHLPDNWWRNPSSLDLDLSGLYSLNHSTYLPFSYIQSQLNAGWEIGIAHEYDIHSSLASSPSSSSSSSPSSSSSSPPRSTPHSHSDNHFSTHGSSNNTEYIGTEAIHWSSIEALNPAAAAAISSMPLSTTSSYSPLSSSSTTTTTTTSSAPKRQQELLRATNGGSHAPSMIPYSSSYSSPASNSYSSGLFNLRLLQHLPQGFLSTSSSSSQTTPSPILVASNKIYGSCPALKTRVDAVIQARSNNGLDLTTTVARPLISSWMCSLNLLQSFFASISPNPSLSPEFQSVMASVWNNGPGHWTPQAEVRMDSAKRKVVKLGFSAKLPLLSMVNSSTAQRAISTLELTTVNANNPNNLVQEQKNLTLPPKWDPFQPAPVFHNDLPSHARLHHLLAKALARFCGFSHQTSALWANRILRASWLQRMLSDGLDDLRNGLWQIWRVLKWASRIQVGAVWLALAPFLTISPHHGPPSAKILLKTLLWSQIGLALLSPPQLSASIEAHINPAGRQETPLPGHDSPSLAFRVPVSLSWSTSWLSAWAYLDLWQLVYEPKDSPSPTTFKAEQVFSAGLMLWNRVVIGQGSFSGSHPMWPSAQSNEVGLVTSWDRLLWDAVVAEGHAQALTFELEKAAVTGTPGLALHAWNVFKTSKQQQHAIH